MDEIFISLDDVKLYVAITEDGSELYTSQDGCYAEYLYAGDIYILTIHDGYLTIEIKEED
jgi:hypothetical protein